MKSLFDVLWEAKEDINSMSIGEMQKVFQAERTSIPRPIALVRQSFIDTQEYELYEFLQFCEWWVVKNKNAPGWHRTAGVRAANEKIEFYYDKEFIDAIGKNPSQLMFLISHEASHIFRLHQDRQAATNRDGNLWNTATDMIINKDILSNSKISNWAPADITMEHTGLSKEEIAALEQQTGKPWKELKDETVGLRVPKEYKEFVDKNKDKLKMPWSSDNIYEFLIKNEKKKEKQGDQKPLPKKDYFEQGTIVKVTSGEHAGEYRKIIKKDSKGGYVTIPVNIQDEIKKVAGGK